MTTRTVDGLKMISITLTWKRDPSAGQIPAYVYFSAEAHVQMSHPIALMFHAGGFVLGSTKMIPQNQIANLISRGFVVDAKEVFKWCQEELPALLEDKRGVEVDASRVVAMGHSAGGQLALTTGLCPNPPRAIVNFYGSVQLADPFWTQGLSMFAALPEQSEEVIAKIYEGPQAITSELLFVDGKPNLSDARCAWYIQQLKNGTSISSIVPDAYYERADATAQFSKDFPPVYFLHVRPDGFADHRLAVKSHEKLKELGVETVLVMGDDIEHGFDLSLKEETGLFEEYVVPALVFLEKHV